MPDTYEENKARTQGYDKGYKEALVDIKIDGYEAVCKRFRKYQEIKADNK